MKFAWPFLAMILTIMVNGKVRADNSRTKEVISRGWEFSQAGQGNWYPATVPGCVHTDLMNNKLIPDPFYGTNESELQWIGENDWLYRTTFDADAGMLDRRNVELVFKGLDTYADVYLNGSLILSAEICSGNGKCPSKGS